MSQFSQQTYLFGGDKSWSPLDWIASDDRVRGGSSISHLTCLPFKPVAEFHGTLDTKTLGGAGFASQRTTGTTPGTKEWNLDGYDGVEIHLDAGKGNGGGKMYTLILKDEILPKGSDGREQSTVSWEFDFRVGDDGEEVGDVEGEGERDAEEGNGGKKGDKIFAKWEEFKPTYRGREKKDAKPLDLKNIKRISIMMRSFFAKQEGDFSLKIISISAAAPPKSSKSLETPEKYTDDPNSPSGPHHPASIDEKASPNQDTLLPSASYNRQGQQGFLSWFFGRCAGISKT